MLGPNMKKLIVRRITTQMDLGNGGVVAMVESLKKFLTGNLVGDVQDATNWAKTAIDAVKSTPDNPYGDDEEAIAGALLAEADKQQKPG